MLPRPFPFAAALLIGALVTLLVLPEASARCLSRTLQISPARGTRKLPRNLQIVIEAYGTQRDKLVELLDGAALLGGGKRMPLVLQRLSKQNASAYKTSHFVLRPTAPLAAAQRYRLVLAQGQKPPASLSFWTQKLRAYEIATGRALDTTQPKAPKLISKGYAYQRFGCGPASSIGLKLQGLGDDRTPAARLGVLLQVVERGSKGKRAFALRLRAHHEGQLSFGHGMCSGNFGQLQKGARYTLRARLVDEAGNVSKPSNPVTVEVR